MNFMDKCVRGLARLSEINDHVDAWHRNEDVDQPLAQYLGLTHRQYCDWILDPESIVRVFFIKKTEYLKSGNV